MTVSSLRGITTRFSLRGAVTAMPGKTRNKKPVTLRANGDDLRAAARLKHTVRNRPWIIQVNRSSPSQKVILVAWSAALGNLPAFLLNVTFLLFRFAPNGGSYRVVPAMYVIAICYINHAIVATCLEFQKDGGGPSR